MMVTTPVGSGGGSGATGRNGSGFAAPLRPGSWNVSAWYRKAGSQWRAYGYHTGVDFAAPQGTPVYAITDGVLTNAGSGALGSALGIVAQLAFGSRSAVYAHLSALASGVRVGSKVKAGQVIGYVGNTGTNSSGPHLHFEIQNVRNGWGHHTDPAPFIAGQYPVEGYGLAEGGGGDPAAIQYGTGEGPPETARDRAQGDGNLNSGSGDKWLARFLYAKGLRGNDLKTAWAIAMRESRGLNIDSKHKSFNGADYGLFQINQVHAAAIKKKFGWTLDEVGRDPNKNFAVMWWMSNGLKKLGPWDLGPDAYAGGNTDAGNFRQWAAKFEPTAKAAGLTDTGGSSDVSRAYRQGGALSTADSSSGGGGSGTGVDTLSPKDAAAEYGYAWALFNSDPELMNLLKEAIDNDWNSARFEAALQNTDWFREHSPSWRAAEELYYTDPQKYKDELGGVEREMLAFAAALGVDVPDDMVKKLAWRAYRYGWDDNQMRAELVKYLKPFDTGGYAGQAGTLEDTLRKTAFENGVTMPDSFYQKAVSSVIGGTRTQEEWDDYIRQQAATQFPVFSANILAGVNMRSLAGNYLNTMAQTLDLNPDTIELNDPWMQKALNGVDASGNPYAMGLYEFQRQLKSDPRWGYTANAMNDMASALNGLGRMFGFVS